MDIEARDLTTVDEELGKRGHAESVVLDFDELLLDAVGSSDREHAKLGFLGCHWSELIDQVACRRVLSVHIVALQHFRVHVNI